MSKIGLDLEAFRQTADNAECAYVRGPGGLNAIPTVVARKFIGDATGKTSVSPTYIGCHSPLGTILQKI